MYTVSLSHSQREELLAPALTATGASAAQSLSDHISTCLQCQFAVAQQRQPLLVAGCSGFQELAAAECLLFDPTKSPLGSLHLSTDMIEEYYFGRLTALERTLLETHIRLCDPCATGLENELLFIHAMQAALAEEVPLDRD